MITEIVVNSKQEKRWIGIRRLIPKLRYSIKRGAEYGNYYVSLDEKIEGGRIMTSRRHSTTITLEDVEKVLTLDELRLVIEASIVGSNYYNSYDTYTLARLFNSYAWQSSGLSDSSRWRGKAAELGL